jgi:HmuY protein
MSFHNLSISVLKVGRQLAGSLVVAAFLLLSITSCLKEENPIQPSLQGNLSIRTINLNQDYKYQVYYNIDKDSIISQNDKSDWDLAFEANTEGSKVYLNPAKFMSAQNTNQEDILSLKDTIGFAINKKVDAANRPDSMALGSVKSLTKVFWIDRGYDEKGDQLDFVKVKFGGVNRQKYTFSICKQGSNQVQNFEINKDTTRNFVYFSFKTNAVAVIEPNKDNWDIVFTQYIHYFNEPYQPYLVTGVLLNPNYTFAAVDSSLTFSKIDKTVAENFKLSQASDVIGYKWKEFGFGSSIYKIYSHYNYIIKNSKGTYFKMHFIDFYDNKGTKGYPKFEFQRL